MISNKSRDEYLKNNAFDVLRYFSVFSVMLLHYTYYAITMSEQRIDFLRVIRRITEFFPGVVILFSLSGFLISASFERCKTKKEFVKKRVFRLYPELWLCTLINSVIILFLAREKLDNSFIVWIITQIFGTGSVNGALWTIFTEVQLYVILGITYNWTKKLKQKGWCFLLVLVAIANLVCNYVSQVMGGGVAKIIERLFLPYTIWFMIGVFCYQKREKVIPLLKKYVWIILLIFAINQGFSICSFGYYEDIVTGITLSFATIGLAYTLPSVRMKYDISYGIFLYHWIIINIMVHLDIFSKMSWAVCGVFFIIATFVLSYASKVCVNHLLKKV